MSGGLFGKCRSCGHVFLVVKLPMPVTEACEAMLKAACTSCGDTKNIAVATADEAAGAADQLSPNP